MENLLAVVLISLGLSADCFAVAISGSISLKKPSVIQTLRVASSFGAFQALMTFLGWLAGQTIVEAISAYDHWLAFGLLAFVGLRMIKESLRYKTEEKRVDMTRGLMLLVLSLATSLDALAVGLSIALMQVHIGVSIGIIGATAFLVTGTGFLLGHRLGSLIGKRAELIGGLVLIGIGIKILIEHLGA
ncbi:MAG: manganese efflux pump MntP family protein [Dehalococcoidales bacterium]|nr:manganese efflux pump MntP family protein [Dehalococcoidales bacterium]